MSGGMTNYEFHPVANLFPMMDTVALSELQADIDRNGLREPIWLHQGKIIDGRNRYLACKEISKEPAFREWSGEGSLVSFVVSLNLHRRHLNTSQRSIIALDILPLLEEEAKERMRLGGRSHTGNQYSRTKLEGTASLQGVPKGESAQKAGEMLGISARSVYKAKAIAREAPEKIEEIKRGNASLETEYYKLRPRPANNPATPPADAKPEPKYEKEPVPQNLCHNYAVMAMANLDRIQKGDPQGKDALFEVWDYINQRLEKEFSK